RPAAHERGRRRAVATAARCAGRSSVAQRNRAGRYDLCPLCVAGSRAALARTTVVRQMTAPVRSPDPSLSPLSAQGACFPMKTNQRKLAAGLAAVALLAAGPIAAADARGGGGGGGGGGGVIVQPRPIQQPPQLPQLPQLPPLPQLPGLPQL